MNVSDQSFQLILATFAQPAYIAMLSIFALQERALITSSARLRDSGFYGSLASGKMAALVESWSLGF